MALETPLALHHTHINLRVVIIGKLFPPEIPDIYVSFFSRSYNLPDFPVIFSKCVKFKIPCYFFQVREV